MAVEHIAGRARNADKLDVMEEHFHGQALVYPVLANPVTLTKAAGAWAAYPTPTEVIPANTVTEDFDIHFVTVSAISANGAYMLAIYEGAGGSETLIAEMDFYRNAVQSQEGASPVITRILAKNTRISMAISSGNAAQDTAQVKARYHVY